MRKKAKKTSFAINETKKEFSFPFKCAHKLFDNGQLESNKLQINPNERIGIYIADKILKHEKIQIIFSVGAQLYVNSILSIKRKS